MTARSTTLVRRPSDLRGIAITETHSQEASGRPPAPRTAGTWSRMAFLSSSSTREVTSEFEPRLTTMALSSRPVPRSAALNPCDIAISTATTATTSAMPKAARSATGQRARTLRAL